MADMRDAIPSRQPRVQSVRLYYGKSRADVATKLAKALAEHENGLTFEAGNLTVGECLYRWMTDSVRHSVRQQTFESYERLVRLHMMPTLGHVRLKTTRASGPLLLYEPSSTLYMYKTAPHGTKDRDRSSDKDRTVTPYWS
jgi:hypothetical protein